MDRAYFKLGNSLFRINIDIDSNLFYIWFDLNNENKEFSFLSKTQFDNVKNVVFLSTTYKYPSKALFVWKWTDIWKRRFIQTISIDENLTGCMKPFLVDLAKLKPLCINYLILEEPYAFQHVPAWAYKELNIKDCSSPNPICH